MKCILTADLLLLKIRHQSEFWVELHWR